MSALESLPATRGRATDLHVAALEALSTVPDPELGEPVTGLGFVRSVAVRGRDLEVRLRLPAATPCSPDRTPLVAPDVLDALRAVPGAGRVRLSVEGHPDAERINRALAGVDAVAFRGRAHRAAIARCCGRLLRETAWTPEELHWLTLQDLHPGPDKDALVRRRAEVGLDGRPHSRVVVDDDGQVMPAAAVPVRLGLTAPVCGPGDHDAHPCSRQLLDHRP